MSSALSCFLLLRELSIARVEHSRTSLLPQSFLIMVRSLPECLNSFQTLKCITLSKHHLLSIDQPLSFYENPPRSVDNQTHGILIMSTPRTEYLLLYLRSSTSPNTATSGIIIVTSGLIDLRTSVHSLPESNIFVTDTALTDRTDTALGNTNKCTVSHEPGSLKISKRAHSSPSLK